MTTPPPEKGTALGAPLLGEIQRHYGIDYRHTLADIIHLNTNATVRQDVFKIHRAGPAAELRAGGSRRR